MRALTLALVLSGLTAVNAHAQEFAQPQSIVSVAQFADVKPSDPHFSALQSLVERYGVTQGYKNGAQTTFRADAPLKRAEMTGLVVAALDQMSQLLAATDIPPAKLSNLAIMQGSKCKATAVSHSSVSQLIDVTPQSPWRADLQNLIEKWNVQVANKDGVFGAGDDVTTAEASACLKIFSKTALSNYPAKLTRGGFAIMLNEALDGFGEDLAAASAN
jgi:hypothetical protein